MAIAFLKTSPEEAVTRLQESARKGYATRHAMQDEYKKAGHGNITDSMSTDWINRINNWINETRLELLDIYESPNYMYKFLEVPPNTISTNEDPRFTNLKFGLLARVETLNGYVDFIIQHSNPTLSIQNNLTYMHLNPERDLNMAGRDVNATSK